MLAAAPMDLTEGPTDNPLSSLDSVIDIDSDVEDVMVPKPMDVDQTEQKSMSGSEIVAWLKTTSLKNDFQASSSGAIKFKGRMGLRSHPAVVFLLTTYFQELYSKLPQAGEEKIVQLGENHNSLVAMLVQESVSTNPAEEVIDVLLPYCEPCLVGVQLRFQLDGTILTLSNLISALASPKHYGLVQNTKQKSLVWEINEAWIERFVPVTVRRLVVARRQAREMLCGQLNAEYRKALGLDQDEVEIIAETIPSKQPSPAKQQKTKPIKQASEKKKPDQNQKLSSFFQVIKKQPVAEIQTEYFQPFQLREGCVLAPTNYFADYMMMSEEDTQLDPSDFWRVFARHAKKSPLAYQGKPQASCLAWPGGSRYFKVKLIQFHGNYRPAYFGTMMKSSRAHLVNGRNPLGHEPGVDYEDDSDDDWAEEMEVAEDAEDILSEDDDDEVEEEEEELDEDEEAEGNWLVPQTDEPLDDMPTFKRQSYKKGEKKRYVQLQPTIYLTTADGHVPDMLRTVKARVLIGEAPIDPFLGAPIPEPVEPATPKMPFPEAALPDLARLASGSTTGVAKLYEQFSAKYGKVSKKQFELRLNQIAEKKISQASGKPSWQIRPEYAHYLAEEPMAMEPVQTLEAIAEVVQEVAMLD